MSANILTKETAEAANISLTEPGEGTPGCS